MYTRNQLKAIAKETTKTLSTCLKGHRFLGNSARKVARICEAINMDILSDEIPDYPHFDKSVVRVENMDCITAALRLPPHSDDDPPPLVLNFANETQPGGGWRGGSMAQEEAICYRTSLSLSLETAEYPIAKDMCLYSPYVAVVREGPERGYALLPQPERPASWPVVSVVSVPALRNPATQTEHINASDRKQDPSLPPGPITVFARNTDREITKAKMTLALAVAASRGHTQLVLGAFGCGVYKNPPCDVALCWREVLEENLGQKAGSWWEDVVFSVLDQEQSTFSTFSSLLRDAYV